MPVAAAVSLLVFLALALAVHTGAASAADAWIRAAVHATACPPLTLLMRTLSAFGEPAVLSILSLATAAALVLRKRRRDAAYFLLALVGTLLLDLSLKLAFHRPRPAASFFDTAMPHSYSFPSGHALFSICFFVLLATFDRRLPVRIAAVVLPFLIGVSRIYLGVHYPSDVVAGWAIGLAWVGALVVGRGIFRQRSGASLSDLTQSKQNPASS